MASSLTGIVRHGIFPVATPYDIIAVVSHAGRELLTGTRAVAILKGSVTGAGFARVTFPGLFGHGQA
jgi:hypothetical protein